MGSGEREDTVFDERKRRDVSLLLTAQVPQERVAQQLGVSLRTVQRPAVRGGPLRWRPTRTRSRTCSRERRA